MSTSSVSNGAYTPGAAGSELRLTNSAKRRMKKKARAKAAYEAKAEVNAAKAAYDKAKAEVDATKAAYDKAKAEVDATKAVYDRVKARVADKQYDYFLLSKYDGDVEKAAKVKAVEKAKADAALAKADDEAAAKGWYRERIDGVDRWWSTGNGKPRED